MYDMIDIHTHILPGLDDGSKYMDTSIAMADVASESGVIAMVATPHSNQRGVYENYVSPEFFEKVEELRREIKNHGIPLEIYSGMEIFGTPEVSHLLREKKLIPINGSRYVLVEFGFNSSLMYMERILFNIMDVGYVPIVAHPERYNDLQMELEIVAEWMRLGICVQVNKGSYFGKFGRGAYEMAHMLTGNGLVSCVASDAHGPETRTPEMAEVSDYISINFSDELAECLLKENPKRILADKPLLRADDIHFF